MNDCMKWITASWFECQKCHQPCFPIHLSFGKSYSQCCEAQMDTVHKKLIEESRLPAWLLKSGQPAAKAD